MENYSAPALRETSAVKVTMDQFTALVAVTILLVLAICIAGACALYCIKKGKSLSSYVSVKNGTVKVTCK